MFINMEEQLSPIMNALAKAAVCEISKLFSEGSATLRLQITRSLKENEALKSRMEVMRRELLFLQLQTRTNASRDALRAASRLALARANICRPGSKPLGNEDSADFGDSSTQRGATSESRHVDAPGSSQMPSHSEELRILSADGKGEGPLAAEGHDLLFTASEVEALSSLSADQSSTTSLERGERLVRREELTVQQQTPDAIFVKVEEDIGGGLPAVEDCVDFVDRSTQHGATSESLHVDDPGSSQMFSYSKTLRILSVAKSLERGERLVHREELTVQQQTPDATLVKVEEDIGGGLPAVEDCVDFVDRSTQHGATSESLHVDDPGSSQMFSYSKTLRILSVAKSLERGERLVHREELTVQQTPDATLVKVEEDIGGGLPAVEDCVDFGDRSTQHGATSESLHVDAPGSSQMVSEELRILSVAKSLERGEWRVHLEELPGHRGGRKGRARVLFGKGVPDNTKKTMPTHNGEKPYGCDQCMKRFVRSAHLRIHMKTHTVEKPYRCDQCMKPFTWMGNMKRHMMTHSGERPYRCDQCMKSFSRNSHLKAHMRTHSGERPFRCDQCMKSYSKSFSLQIHMRTHSGERPFRCDQCTESFIRKSNLKTHIMTHSRDPLLGEALQL
ncbi:zinc finger protein 425-like isoform X3 [Gadus chalcogrammus]|uniref:zinc finger protein 425-like isoform X3 n=1 Tax=Gadus chalcogrammus TaxID=1042646 RepID=UPI0024C49E76|nr:zinc finger protein 425-like isoform X3 [Gadus chalcogrammus]